MLPTVMPDVPIVGQSLQILGYTIVALGQCNCGHKFPMQLTWRLTEQGIYPSVNVCPSCRYSYAIQDITATPSGQIGFTVDINPPPNES